tara:strand:- start:150 stop:704 length:555 start_codon:yes stop_codon:yes gene_type:complete
MNIEKFFLKSVGDWNSMRSVHLLAFQEFEEIRSRIRITPAKINDSRVINLLKDNLTTNNEEHKAFQISWEAKDDWDEERLKNNLSGESILIPIEISKTEGKIIRSVGYTEEIKVISVYKLLKDGTLIINSIYNHVCTEERIWFVSKNVRSRYTVTKAKSSLAILQTSYASEIRLLKKNYIPKHE